VGDRPLVSAIVTTYNRADLLPEAVESVLSQDYPSFEVIIVDDCSEDTTPEVIAGIVRAEDSVRGVRLAQNSGTAGARNAGLREARGPLIAFQDDDDLWMPGRLTAQVVRWRGQPLEQRTQRSVIPPRLPSEREKPGSKNAMK